MKNLYIDFDGVIMDTIPPLYEALKKHNVDPSSKDAQKVIAEFDFKTILKDENIINDAFEAIRDLLKCGKYNVSKEFDGKNYALSVDMYLSEDYLE